MERTRTVREMRRLLRQGGATEPQVLDLLKQLNALDADGPAKTRANLAALDAVLNPLQQAKYRVLETEVEQRMRELMNRVRPRTAPREGQRAAARVGPFPLVVYWPPMASSKTKAGAAAKKKVEPVKAAARKKAAAPTKPAAKKAAVKKAAAKKPGAPRPSRRRRSRRPPRRRPP